MSELTIADLILLFLEDTGKRCKPATVTHYRKRLAGLGRALGTRLLPTLTRQDVLGWIDAEGKWPSGPNAGTPKAPDTVRATIIAWCQFQAWLKRIGHLAELLTDEIKKPGGRKREALPTPAETKLLLAKAPEDFKAIYRAMRLSGARPGELCKAQIAEFDRSKGQIVLKDHKTAHKTGRPRQIAVGHAALIEIINAAVGNRTEGNIFLRSDGQPWTVAALSRKYSSLRDAAELRKDLVLYLARHEHGTVLYQQLGDLKAVADALGHSNLSTTMRYTRVDTDQLKKNQSAFEEGLD